MVVGRWNASLFPVRIENPKTLARIQREMGSDIEKHPGSSLESLTKVQVEAVAFLLHVLAEEAAREREALLLSLPGRHFPQVLVL